MARAHRSQRGAAGTYDRRNLIAGVHKPSPNNTGPYTVDTFQDVYPSGGNTFITISSPGTYYGRRYWGQIRVAAGLPDWSVKFVECHFVGHPPKTPLVPTVK